MPVQGRGVIGALSSGILLRLAGAAVNLLAVPIGLHALGQERYAASVAILSLAGWLAVGSFGLGNVTAISAAEHKDDEEYDRLVFWRIVISAIITVGLAGMIAIAPYEAFFGRLIKDLPVEDRQEFSYASYYCFFAFIVCAISSPFEGRYVGLLRTAYCNFVRLIWQFAAVLMLAATATLFRSILALCFALTVGPLGAAIWFIVRGASEFPAPKSFRYRFSDGIDLIGRGIGFLTSSLAVLFYGGGSLPIFAFAFGTSQLATAAVVSRIIQVFFSGSAVLLHPLSAAIRHAMKDGDVKWAQLALFRSAIAILIVSISALVLLLTYGETIIHAWAGANLPGLDQWMLPLGVLILAIGWSYLWIYTSFSIWGASLVALLAVAEISTICAVYTYFGMFMIPAWSLYISAAGLTLFSGTVLPIRILRSRQLRQ